MSIGWHFTERSRVNQCPIRWNARQPIPFAKMLAGVVYFMYMFAYVWCSVKLINRNVISTDFHKRNFVTSIVVWPQEILTLIFLEFVGVTFFFLLSFSFVRNAAQAFCTSSRRLNNILNLFYVFRMKSTDKMIDAINLDTFFFIARFYFLNTFKHSLNTYPKWQEGKITRNKTTALNTLLFFLSLSFSHRFIARSIHFCIYDVFSLLFFFLDNNNNLKRKKNRLHFSFTDSNSDTKIFFNSQRKNK